MWSERGWYSLQRGWHQQEVGGRVGGGAAGRIQDRGKLLWLERGVREDIPHRVTEITRGRSERALPPKRRSSDLFSVQQDSGLHERFGKESDGS